MKFFKTFLASLLGSLAALFAAFLLMFAFLGAIASIGSSEPIIPEKAILTINLADGISEQTTEDIDIQGLLAGGNGMTNSLGIYDAIRAIDAAAQDPGIPFIYLKCDNANISIASCEELRKAIERFRQSGKPVIAYADNFTQGALYLASVADKIYTAPLSNPMIQGLSSQILFLKDLFDELGVDIQLIRHGKYKSAGEQYIASNISEANREQQEAYLKGLWGAIARPICEGRNLDLNTFNQMINDLKLSSAEDLVNAGLIDSIITRQELRDLLCNQYGEEDPDQVKTVDLGAYASVKVKEDLKIKDKIAVLYANGQINGADGEGITTNPMIQEIRKIREDENIKAVVLRVNSPGGNAQTAELIRKELELLGAEKPLIASYGDYAASGGYWISAGTEKIYSNATTLTGSIGVFSMIPNIGGAIRKIAHINPVSINTHKHSDMGTMRALDRTETATMQNMVDDIYVQFVQLVADGRQMSTEEVDAIAQGRVWCGEDALKIKLVDEIGGLEDAIRYAAIAAGLEEYRVSEFPKAKTGVEKLMESFGNASATFASISNPEQLIERLQEAAAGRNVYARLPYVVLDTNW